MHLANAASTFGEREYEKIASKTANFILSKMRDEKGRLYHRYRDGEVGIMGLLSDYAFFIWGLLNLYEVTFEVEFFQEALALNEILIKHFWDKNCGCFYTTPDFEEPVLIRKRTLSDSAIPLSNSIAMINLIRLARMTGDAGLEENRKF